MITASFSLFRSLLIYGICVPLALVLGYLITTPYDFTSFTVVGLVLFLLVVPLLLKWHHVWLIAVWNMCAVLFFVPGKPMLWLPLTWISLFISVFHYTLNRKAKFLYVPEVIKPLILLVLITLVTAKLRGGFGVRAFGSETFGAKRYFMIVTAIVGYFAITSQRIPPHRVPLYVALYFLGAATMAIGELAVFVTPAFYFLFWIFPVSEAGLQVIGDPGSRGAPGTRLGGLATAGSAVYLMMLCRYGIQELFSWRRLGRFSLFLFFLFVALLGGFRSTLILFLMTFCVVFYLEGLMRSHLLPLFLLAGVLGGAAIVPVVDRLPLMIQRSLSFLPLPIDPMVRQAAQASTEWRLQMWKHVVSEVPEYLFLGKGYSFSAKDLAMTRILGADRTGAEGAELAGDYHNGPLSVIIPFGIPGSIAFLWLLWASLKVLRQNYLFGDPVFRRINTFLLAHFLAKTVFFFAIFGGLYGDLPTFIGLLALSVSINGGVRRAAAVVPQPALVLNRFKLQPPTTKPAGA
jgi:hypothetical protein